MTQPDCTCHFPIGGERYENPYCPAHGSRVPDRKPRTVEPTAEGPDRFACGDCGSINVHRPRPGPCQNCRGSGRVVRPVDWNRRLDFFGHRKSTGETEPYPCPICNGSGEKKVQNST